MANRQAIKSMLKDFNEVNVSTFIKYVEYLGYAKNTKGERIADFIDKKSNEWLVETFKKVDAEGLAFDGKHVTLTSRGVTYDYIAYKNKVLLIYPESVFDVQAVYEGDEFAFKKESGRVVYSHSLSNPFVKTKRDENIIGAYCVIKNSRGEFLTTINQVDISKHRAKAMSDSIWKEWFLDMVLKTVIRKACKIHFDDIVGAMIIEDEKYTDLDNPIGVDLAVKQAIEKADTIDALTAIYKAHGKQEGVNALLTKRKNEIASKKEEE